MGVPGLIRTIASALREPTTGTERGEDYCSCPTPLLDSDVGEADGDDDFCWRCRRFLPDEGGPGAPERTV